MNVFFAMIKNFIDFINPFTLKMGGDRGFVFVFSMMFGSIIDSIVEGFNAGGYIIGGTLALLVVEIIKYFINIIKNKGERNGRK